MLVWALIATTGGGHVSVVDEHCRGREFSCGVAAGVFTTVLPILVAFVSFAFIRVGRVGVRYQRHARSEPHRMLQAPKPEAGIVGRDDLCEVLEQEFERHEEEDQNRSGLLRRGNEGDGDSGRSLRGRRRPRRRERRRRPIVLVGGVGVGKTAVLVRLTKLLAEHGVLPIPIRLRDAQTSLDFVELAREKFLKVLLIPGLEGDRIWQRLLDDDRIVIVADGLEEALTGVVEARETAIQVAVEDVRDSDVPLVIASRPHDVLNYLDVRMLRVEPLAPFDALAYIRAGDEAADPAQIQRIQRIVQNAEVVEMPLFMEIARQLQQKDLLHRVDMRHVGRLGLRVRLLDVWIDALIGGSIEPLVALKPDRRREVVEKLESLACVGLLNDDLDVSFRDLAPSATPVARARRRVDESPDLGTRRKQVAGILETEPAKLRAVAADGARLRLVDPLADGVRFRHSTVQAYLGSRRIDRFFEGEGGARLVEALRDPGRELLMALEMKCVVDERVRPVVAELLRGVVCGTAVQPLRQSAARFRPSRAPAATFATRLRDARDVLRGAPSSPTVAATAARTSEGRELSEARPPMTGWKTVTTAASAVSVHSTMGPAQERARAADDGDQIRDGETGVDQEIDSVIETAWRHAGDADPATDEAKISAVARIAEARRYDALWRICCLEGSYRVRLYAVRKLGGGGLPAFEAVKDRLDAIASAAGSATTPLPDRADARAVLAERGVLLGSDHDRQPDRAYALHGLLLPQLFQSVVGERARADPTHLARDAAHLETDVRETAVESTAVAGEIEKAAAHVREAEVEARRSNGRARADAKATMRTLLADWVRAARAGHLYRTSEIALAHGFKHAANRRPELVAPETRQFLSRQAETLLEGSSFWFTQLAAMQALTLWMLGRPEAAEGGGDDALRKIDHWGARTAHPFVKEAAELCKRAIEQRKPARYIWMEEVEVIAKLGPSSSFVENIHDHRELDINRWIPRAAGWYTLVPEAQQLVADIVVLLNLADRGDTTVEREENLNRAVRDTLPPCMERPEGRAHLRVDRPLDDPTAGPPGTTCHSDCDMHLCPYPALGEELSREELAEPFCRLQQGLVAGRARKRPPWQLNEKPAELRKFWAAMERRRRL
jgi:hypothetical protein